jgi:hypothetical protein
LLDQFVHCLVNREAPRLLAWWKFHEGREMLSDDRLGRDEYECVLNEPFVIAACLVVGTFEGVGSQVKDLGRTQRY